VAAAKSALLRAAVIAPLGSPGWHQRAKADFIIHGLPRMVRTRMAQFRAGK